MTFFDLPLDQLRTYLPPRDEPGDYDQFWSETLAETRAHPLNARFEPFDAGLKLVDSLDVTFNGFGGQPIKGWLMLPRSRTGRLPCVVEFIGYGGGRGHALDWLTWSVAGYAHFIMDTRGQGSTWRAGDTPDVEPPDANPHHPGFMTRGVLKPRTYYYRRVFCDAVRAVEAARSHPEVDADRVAVTGGSQGGGISLAVAGLDRQIGAVMPDVPFLCHYRVATEITDDNPYGEIIRYCVVHRDKVEQVFETLRYFDGVNFAARAHAPALFSVALRDEICPPRTVFAAYNHYAGSKAINVWSYNNHEGGATYQLVEKLRFLSQLWGEAG
jgi:cephalosporin-C deacetylase